MGVSWRRLAPLWALVLTLACARGTGRAQDSSAEHGKSQVLLPGPQVPGGHSLHFLPPLRMAPVVRALNPAHNGRVCSTWGNFHYKTFDGDIFHFPGLCNYVLSAHCGAAYEDFNIQLRRGLESNATTVIRVTMKLDGMVIQLTKNAVLANGQLIQLPFSQSGVLIEHSSNSLKVVARLGLVFMWSQDDSLLLELDAKYANQTCGLCGDFNSEPVFNEFLSHGVKLTPIQFGNLQKMDGPTEQCQDPVPVPMMDCSPGSSICEEILSSRLFSGCSALVDASSYVQACRHDLCACEHANPSSCICHTLAEYSRQCAHAGGLPLDWRGPDLCPQTCPLNMQYRECGSPCADTCSNPEHSQLCEDHCMAGCFCPEGMVLDDIGQTGCIPASQCACVYNGATYAPGAVYSTDCTNCTCLRGQWSCQEVPCPGTCSVLGGAHFSTFDERRYTVHGDCSYVLVKPCNSSTFTVLAELRKCGLTDTETCLRSLTLSLGGGHTVITVKASGEVFVNQIYTQMPISAGNVTLFRPSTFFIIAQTNLGLQLDIQLVPIMQVFVRLGPELRGLTCGLCGNFNQNQADDFRALSGVVEGTAAAFANTWKTQATCPNVKNSFEDPCSLSVENEKYAQHWCSRLTDPHGPFAQCHTAVNPGTYYSNCMFDTCNCEKSEDCLCAALSSYVHACAANGVLLSGWRDSVCTKPMATCPKSLTYQYHIDTCQPTCRSRSHEDITCGINFVPVDGCTCPTGTFMDDTGKCVPPTSCPCYHGGSMVPNGESLHERGAICTCTQGMLTCIGGQVPTPVCTPPMVYLDCRNATPGATGAGCQKSCFTLDMDCYSSQCEPGCVCPDGLVSDGKGGCVAVTDCPCVHNEASYLPGQTIWVGCNTCTCKNRMWKCTDEPCLATCAVYGDGHYLTFDGRRYSFSGDCAYTLVQDHCGGNSTANATFRVVTENVPCGTTGVTCSKAIKLFLGSYELRLSGGSVEVIEKGAGQAAPYSIRQMGIYLVVDTEVGLVLLWDRKTSIFLKLSPEFKGRVCGLCGNFDDNAVNDFTTRSQSVVGSTLEFGNSWKFSPSCPDAPAPRDPCTANPYRKSWSQKQCSIINSATFAACHAHVEPAKYYEACVGDACACDSGGDCECFCTAVAAYAQACHDVGVCVSWRTPDICPLFCDYYNPEGQCEWHYQPCGVPCMRTCRNPSGRCLHDLHGLEGCYPKCPPEAPIFDEDQMQCVATCPTPPPPLPCRVQGKSYWPGSAVPSEENCQSCVCTESGVQCVYDAEACVCTYDGSHFHLGDVIYHTTDGTGGCISARCSVNGTIERKVYTCSSTTPAPPTTFSFSTPSLGVSSIHPPRTCHRSTKSTVHTNTPSSALSSTLVTASSPMSHKTSVQPHVTCGEECLWSPWLDVSHPGRGIDSGDFDTLENLRAHGYHVCSVPKEVECQAEGAPEVPLQVLGQHVECSPTVGLVCYNRNQTSGLCYNYQIRILCCFPGTCSTSSTPPPPPASTPTPSRITEMVPTSGVIRVTPVPTHNKPSPATVTATGTTTLSTTSKTHAPGTTTPTPGTTTLAPSTPTPLLVTSTIIPSTFTLALSTPLSVPVTTVTIPGTPTHVPGTTTTTTGTPTPTQSATTTTLGSPTTVKNTTFTLRSTPASTTPAPCLQNLCSWTHWLDGSYPEPGINGGDFDTFPNLRATGYKFCEKPSNVECRAAFFPNIPLDELGQDVICDKSVGLMCLNKNQFPPICYNYEIRIQCCELVDVCTSTTSPVTAENTHTTPRTTQTHTQLTSTTGIPLSPTQHSEVSSTQVHSSTSNVLSTNLVSVPTTINCQPRCTWTKWFDVDFPSPGPHGGDVESFSNIMRRGEKICRRPEYITQLECRAESHPEVSIDKLGQVVQCNLTKGLVCRNQDQKGNVGMCLNYEVRVLCCETPEGCPHTKTVTVSHTPSVSTSSLKETTTHLVTSHSTSVPTASPKSVSTTTSTSMPTTGRTSGPETSSTSVPTTAPTSVPTTSSTSVPPSSPTSVPKTSSTSGPTTGPTTVPTTSSTTVPTTGPTSVPTTSSTSVPTTGPTTVPTTSSTTVPTTGPTSVPTTSSTSVPPSSPTSVPEPSSTSGPTTGSTTVPTTATTSVPTTAPTSVPTTSSTSVPPSSPTSVPESSSTFGPTTGPTTVPTTSSTTVPTTGPTSVPTTSSTSVPPSSPTSVPEPSSTSGPTTGSTTVPTTATTSVPTTAPTSVPTTSSTSVPTSSPTTVPTTSSTSVPPSSPTSVPKTSSTSGPTTGPTTVPTTSSTSVPTTGPTTVPTTSSTTVPTTGPTSVPTKSSTSVPPSSPTFVPESSSTSGPTTGPTTVPTTSSTTVPTTGPNSVPTTSSTSVPPSSPTSVPEPSSTSVSTTAPRSVPATSSTPMSTTRPIPVPTTRSTSVPTTSPTSVSTVSTTSVPRSSSISVPITSPTSVPTTSPISVPKNTKTTVPKTSPTSMPTTSSTSVPATSPTSAPKTSSASVPTTSATTVPTTSLTSLPASSPTSLPKTTTMSAPTTSTIPVLTSETTHSPYVTVTCQPQCTWTKWFDVDFPSPGPHGGDAETFCNIKKRGEKICRRPEYIAQLECRAESHPEVSIDKLGQVVQCNVTKGLVCRNRDQKGNVGMCLNYEVRVLCCETPEGCPHTKNCHSVSHPKCEHHQPKKCVNNNLNLYANNRPNIWARNQLNLRANNCPNLCANNELNFCASIQPNVCAKNQLNLWANNRPNNSSNNQFNYCANDWPNLCANNQLNFCANNWPNNSSNNQFNYCANNWPNLCANNELNFCASIQPNIGARTQLNLWTNNSPTTVPTMSSTSVPPSSPTSVPKTSSTSGPTTGPTTVPTTSSTSVPTTGPTTVPTTSSTTVPTTGPTSVPTTSSTSVPPSSPTSVPESSSTSGPTTGPTTVPTTSSTTVPTTGPNSVPTTSSTSVPPSSPTSVPEPSSTSGPTTGSTTVPTTATTSVPTTAPTSVPTTSSTSVPTSSPTTVPTTSSTSVPPSSPTSVPKTSSTSGPTTGPTTVPTTSSTSVPTTGPTTVPTTSSTTVPTTGPTSVPTKSSTSVPPSSPTFVPESSSTSGPTTGPTTVPTTSSTTVPTTGPNSVPTTSSTSVPPSSPTSVPEPSSTSVSTTAPRSVPATSSTPMSTTRPIPVPTTRSTSVPTTSPTSVSTVSTTSVPRSSSISVPITSPTSVPTTSPISVPKTTKTTVPKTSPTSMPTTSSTSVPATSPTSAPKTSSASVPTTSATTVPTTSLTSLPASSPTSLPKTTTMSAPTTSTIPVLTSETTHSPYVTVTCQPQCTWTKWFDVDFPSPGPHGGDAETFCNIKKRGEKICRRPEYIAQLECRAESHPEVSIDKLGQVVQCNVTKGLVCRNRDQKGNVGMCLNYEVRVLCCETPEGCPHTKTVTVSHTPSVSTSSLKETTTHLVTSHSTSVPTASPKSVSTTTSTSMPTTGRTSGPETSSTSVPTTAPTSVPTTSSTSVPPSSPTSVPKTSSTSGPTTGPTTVPTTSSTTVPTTGPTSVPTTSSTSVPTTGPTTVPTTSSTTVPTTGPTSVPTTSSTSVPPSSPTSVPEPSSTSGPTTGSTTVPTTTTTSVPTTAPTSVPTTSSTSVPTSSPTTVPTMSSTSVPPSSPTSVPKTSSTSGPTTGPTTVPTTSSTSVPTTGPTTVPTTSSTTVPTTGPTSVPTTSSTSVPPSSPTSVPESSSTSGPTTGPTTVPTTSSTTVPTTGPNSVPTTSSTSVPPSSPTSVPEPSSTSGPTTGSTTVPTTATTSVPTTAPTSVPTTSSTSVPTSSPTTVPTTSSTSVPPSSPTSVPKTSSTSGPTTGPTTVPTTSSTSVPTTGPTTVPTTSSTTVPTTGPTSVPTTSSTSVPPSSPTPTSMPTTSSTSVPATSPTSAPKTSSASVPTTSATTVPTTSLTSLPASSPTSLPKTTTMSAPTTSTIPVLTSETTHSPYVTVTCQPQCTWTKWFDVDFPSPGPHGGDAETFCNIKKRGEKICRRPEYIAQLECRAESHPEVSIDKLGQVVQCNVTKGLVCRNRDQKGNVGMCLNYEVRVLCCEPPEHCGHTSVTPHVTSSTNRSPPPEFTSVVSTVSFPSSVAPSTTTCYCSVSGKLYPAGSIIYQQTDLAGHCYYAMCSLDCQVVRWSDQSCSSSVPPPAPTTSPPGPSLSASVPVTMHGCPNAIPPRMKGETWPMPNCSQATCQGNGVITVHPRSCPQTQPPTCTNGFPPVKVTDHDDCCPNYQCQCVCSGWGDPHYITFDGTYYSFLDNCTYVLVQQIVPVYGHFRVLINNYFCGAEDGLSCPQSIIVEYQQARVVMTRKPILGVMTNEIIFNDQVVRPGFQKDGVSVSQIGIKMYVTIPKLGVQVMFSGLIFSVEVPFSKFANNTEGQCGTCSNDKRDECRLPGGVEVASCSAMSSHWRVTTPDQPYCYGPLPTPTAAWPTPSPSSCPPAPVCHLILSKVFGPCHAVIPPLAFYEGCVFDHCHKTDSNVMCSALELYASLCASRGVCIDWRSHTNHTCPFTCPADKVYQPCGPSKPSYCYGSDNTSLMALQDSGPITEGCFCPEGMKFFSRSSEVCVPIDCHKCLGPHGKPVEPGHSGPSNSITVDCQWCTCENHTLTMSCQRQPCPLPPACPLPGFVPVPAAPQAGQCCPQYNCACDTSYCPKPVACPEGSRPILTYEEGACCPSQNCSWSVCNVNGTLYQPGSVVSSSLCETCRCEAPDGPHSDTVIISCETQICNTHCPVGFEYQPQSGQCCGLCVQQACVVNSSNNSTHLFYPGQSWPDPGNPCMTHECEKHQDGLVVVTTKKACPPLSCPEEQALPSKDGCCLSCPLHPPHTSSTCAVYHEQQVISQQGCSSPGPVHLAYCQGNCGDSSSRYSLETKAMKHTCQCCQELRVSLRNVTLHCADGSSWVFSYPQVEECGCVGQHCGSEESRPEQSGEEQSEEIERTGWRRRPRTTGSPSRLTRTRPRGSRPPSSGIQG
ncbi:mucin-5AC isoform X1 [Canis lupus familiaris]|uniref:mucin-5AC isoform X1 n=1 Tax=Canis lupus familiaris TaxID=9615 RepID=UPI0018F7E297|nr:mucin-5AC isoform X1 [Canis lupus familiaris]